MGKAVTLFPTPKKPRPRRVIWITVPHGSQAGEEPLASLTRRGAIADIEYYDGHASVHKYVLAESKVALGAARRRFKRAVRSVVARKRTRT